MKKKGFTLIELLIVVAIIAMLATAILMGLSRSRKDARINSSKTSLKTVLPAIISCRDSSGTVVVPSNVETGTKAICNPSNNFSNSFWPQLSGGYQYIAGGNYSVNCNFKVSTNQDVTLLGNTFLTCSCDNQLCE